MTEENEGAVGKLLESLTKSELSPGEQVSAFVAMLDVTDIVNHLKSKGMSINIGIDISDPVYTFTYGVLKLLRPELFEEKPEETKP